MLFYWSLTGLENETHILMSGKDRDKADCEVLDQTVRGHFFVGCCLQPQLCVGPVVRFEHCISEL